MSIEKELRQNWDDVVYPEPDVPEQPILLAQAPTDQTVVSDAGAGRLNLEPQAKMESYDPTVRQKIADFLQAGFEAMGTPRYQARKNAQTIMGGESSNLPLNIGIADIVPFIGTAMQTEDAAVMAKDAAADLEAGRYGDAALKSGVAAISTLAGAPGTIKATKSITKAVKSAVKGAE